MNKRLLPALILAAFGGMALAKLPAPDPAAKAKADETAAKAAWQAKAEAYQLCKSQDKIAARFGHKGGGAKPQALPVVAKPAESAPAAAASAPAAAASASASAPVAAASKPVPAASAAAAATAGPSTPTPAVASAPPPCTDPGPFAYNPPDQKPLETSGAHSPTGTASGAPSVSAESAKIAPAKKP
jgi:hypothetical protein